MSHAEMRTILDDELDGIRDRYLFRHLVVHTAIEQERRRAADAVIVAAREARIEVEKAHARVRVMVTA